MIGKVTMAAVAALILGLPAAAQDRRADSPPGATAVDPQLKRVLDQLAQDVMAAQQVGYLAADKNMAAGYALLGDQIALTNSQINRRLDEIVQNKNLDLPRVMNEQSRTRFERMKTMNQDEFAQTLVRFVDETYPRIISGIEALSAQSPDAPAVAALAEEAVPTLRDQMRTAQQLAQGGGLGEQRAEDINRGPIQRKDDPAVMGDTTPPIEPRR